MKTNFGTLKNNSFMDLTNYLGIICHEIATICKTSDNLRQNISCPPSCFFSEQISLISLEINKLLEVTRRW